MDQTTNGNASKHILELLVSARNSQTFPVFHFEPRFQYNEDKFYSFKVLFIKNAKI